MGGAPSSQATDAASQQQQQRQAATPFGGPPGASGAYFPQQGFGGGQPGGPFGPPGRGAFANTPLQPQPYPYAQPPPPGPRAEPQPQRTNTVRNHVNLNKQTLKLVPVKEEPGKYTVEFTFDAAAPCSVSVFFIAAEAANQGCRLTPVHDEPPARVERPQGLRQTFVWEELLDPRRYKTEELVQAGGRDGETYPLVVRLECVTGGSSAGAAGGEGPRRLPEPAGAPLPTWVQAQTTYATLQPVEGGWAVRVAKQRVWVEGVCYEIQEIYGIEHCATGNASEDATAGKECVVCLSEPRDTTVLPCRHMCMCSGCARALRHQTNRCPICRTPVESLLQIKVGGKGAAPPARAP